MIAWTIIEWIMLVRSSLDTIMAGTVFFGGMGFGAIINIVMIIACLFVIAGGTAQRPPVGLGAWLAYLALAGISLTFAPEPGNAIRFYATLLSNFLLYCAPFYIRQKELLFPRVPKLIVYSSIIPIGVALIEGALGHDYEGSGRYDSTFTHPNILAFYLLVCLTAALLLMGPYPLRSKRKALYIYIALLFPALILTQTRSAWIGAAATIFIYLILVAPRVAAFMPAGGFALSFIPAISDRLNDAGSAPEYIGEGVVMNSYDWRLTLWQSALPSIEASPLFGHGFNSFIFYSPTFFSLEVEGVYAHNVYLQIAFESGIIALLCYGLVFIQLIYFALTRIRVSRLHASALFVLVLWYIICSYSDNMLYYLAMNWYFWFFAGTLGAFIAKFRPQPAADS